MASRPEALTQLAQACLAVGRPHPVRVAIDGCSAAGKTTLADELAQRMRDLASRPVIRIGLDYFMRAVSARTVYPLDSPESYYFDSWDYDAIRDQVLVPLGPGGSGVYRDAVMDPRGRSPINAPVQHAVPNAILLADGCFLQRPELIAHWDLRIYVDVGFDVVLRRGVIRDQQRMGPEARERYLSKYIPAERRYVTEVRPRDRAHIVVENEDFTAPRIVVRTELPEHFRTS